eukprot:TRINITY_DN1758_c0_g4_i2.p1 TRINITY_DN1758_c0_g4~~TRINITY_DN1758_c0_g4_i2.p1  ORF type:complete len:254 (-),score=56.33 TRINITY_DN1758_c0_g4_i2:137-898(-)
MIKSIAFIALAVDHEKSMGTVRFFLYFTLTTLLSNLLFNLLMLLLSTLHSAFLKFPFYGLTPFLMVEIVIEANKNPEENRQYFLMPSAYKAKYYPLAMFVVLSVFTGFDVFPLLAGVAVGYLHVWKLISVCYDCKKTCVERFDTNWFFALIGRTGGFYSVGMAEEFVRSDGDRMPVCDRSGVVPQTVALHSAKEDPFKGEGVKVGEEEKTRMENLGEAIRKAEGRRPASRLVQEHENRYNNATTNDLVLCPCP